MALSRPKVLVLILLCLGLFPQCSSRVSRGKPEASVTQKKRVKRPSGYVRKPGLFIWPSVGPINSPYGARHGRPHDGIDIGGDRGDPVIAAAGGEVVFEGRLGGYGKLIVIKHDNGYFTAYAHNQKNLVSKGKRVKQGQRIAKVGRSGNASGDHLHFEIRDEENTYDPEDFLPEKHYAGK
ncbi:MAG TPA: hypothetical protein DF383_10670 [Deltaproteobacteria bacterium]|nr:hypothetical protein [Deltaproteobacteria bacterium]